MLPISVFYGMWYPVTLIGKLVKFHSSVGFVWGSNVLIINHDSGFIIGISDVSFAKILIETVLKSIHQFETAL